LVSAFDFDFELYGLKKEEFKDLIFEEIMMYHDETLLKEYMKNKATYP
jgi:predicted small metal-binding protein